MGPVRPCDGNWENIKYTLRSIWECHVKQSRDQFTQSKLRTNTHSCTIFAWSALRSFLTKVTLEGVFFFFCKQNTCKSVMWSVEQISTAAFISAHSVSFGPGNASTSSFSGHTLQAGGSLSSKGARRSDGSLLCCVEKKNEPICLTGILYKESKEHIYS